MPSSPAETRLRLTSPHSMTRAWQDRTHKLVPPSGTDLLLDLLNLKIPQLS